MGIELGIGKPRDAACLKNSADSCRQFRCLYGREPFLEIGVNVLVHYALYLISSIKSTTKGDVVAGDPKRLAVAWGKHRLPISLEARLTKTRHMHPRLFQSQRYLRLILHADRIGAERLKTKGGKAS